MQESDSKLNQLSVPSPKFALHESKSQSSPSSQGLSLLDEEDLNEIAIAEPVPLTIEELNKDEKDESKNMH